MTVKLKPCSNRNEAWPRLNEASKEFVETIEQPVKPFEVRIELTAHYDGYHAPGDYTMDVHLSLSGDRHDQYLSLDTLAITKVTLSEYLDRFVVKRFPALAASVERLKARAFAWMDELPEPWPWWTDGTFMPLQ